MIIRKNQLKKLIDKLTESTMKEYSGANGAKDTSFYPKNNRGPVGGMFSNLMDPYGSYSMSMPWGTMLYPFYEETDLGHSLNRDKIKAEKERHIHKKAQLTPERVRFLGNLLNVNWDKVDFNEFTEGMWTELEHGLLIPRLNVTNDNLVQTAKVALSHLIEDPQYYTKLKKYIENDPGDSVKHECRFDRDVVLEKKFIDFKKFKAAPDNEKFVFLGINQTPLLGTGTARQAFLVDSNSVVKMAMNKKGLAQNKAELDIFTNPNINGVVNKIYDYDPNYRWILVEVVREMTDAKEFFKLTRVHWKDFTRIIEGLWNEMIPESQINKPFIKLVWDTIKTGDLKLGDTIQLYHWGKTVDGRIVLLDYGFTKEVGKKYYVGPAALNSGNDKLD